MVDMSFTLLGGNGDSIWLDGSDGFYLTTGFRGLGIAATNVRIDESAGDGGTWRSTTRGIREFDLPIVVLGSDRADVESKLRRLAAALADRYGTPYLVAQYSDGTKYSIEVHYTGGAETTFGSEANETFCRWVITLQAPDPYWTSSAAVQFSLANPSTARGLLPRLDQLQVQNSAILGSFSVENPGDVDAFPVWTIDGTSTSATITLGSVGFSYTETIATGTKRIINTRAGTVVDGSGTNKYAYLAAAPKLFAIPPGSSTISVTISGADATTKVSGYFNPRREVLH